MLDKLAGTSSDGPILLLDTYRGIVDTRYLPVSGLVRIVSDKHRLMELNRIQVSAHHLLELSLILQYSLAWNIIEPLISVAY